MDVVRVRKLYENLKGHTKTSQVMEQLSGVMIIIIIGTGVILFVMLFIFAKRQIMRFTLRSRRGPHVPVGNDAKKNIRREIERRLDCIQKIVEEPKLLWTEDKYIMPEQPPPAFYYRMKAVDDVKILEGEISRSDGSTRHPSDSLRAFLLTTLSATCNGSGQRMIQQFCDMYEHARHDPSEFGSEEYGAYNRLLLKLIEAAKQLKSFANSRKTSPARTPKKQMKMHSLLDPGRLRPPPLTNSSNSGEVEIPPTSELNAGQHSKVNLTLGLHKPHSDSSSPSELDTAANLLQLRTSVERDHIIRNRIKTPTLDHSATMEDYNDNAPLDDDDALEDNEIRSISAVKFQANSSVV